MDEQALKPGALGFEGADSPRQSSPLEERLVELYSTLRPSLVGYAYQFVGSTGDGEDLVQIAFLKLFDQLKRKSDIQNVRSWLYRVVHNLAVDHIRRKGVDEVVVTDWWASHPEETNRTAEDVLIAQQQIARSLGVLNDRERNCLTLRAEGLSYQEISDVLGISPKLSECVSVSWTKKFEGRNDAKA